MKAIVVVFFRILKPEISGRQLNLRQGDDTWTPPFWTWFIENPRLR